MKHRLAYISGTSCILLAVLIALLWVRAFWVSEGLVLWINRDWGVGAFSHEDGLYFFNSDLSAGRPIHLGYYHRPREADPFDPYEGHFNPARFGFIGEPPVEFHQLSVPFWFLLGVLFILSAACFQVLRKGHRCAICGFDIRKSKDKCPECGQPIARTEGTEARLHDGKK